MECLFCKIINNEIPSYTIYEDDYVKCFLDVNPKSCAHTLIVPKKHFKDVNDIDEVYYLKIHEASKKVMDIINKTFKPVGYQLIQNNGNLQDVKHYHLHIIPSYNKKMSKDNVESVYNQIVK